MANQLGGYWKLAETIKGIIPNKDAKPTTAVVRNIDPDGTVWVAQSGSDDLVPVTGINVASVSVDDVVMVDSGNGRLSITGNASEPSVGERTVNTTAQQVVNRAAYTLGAAAAAAKAVADEAKAVAEATNQHFFTDTNGIHVTEVTQEEWESEQTGLNVLINSSGQLFRNALKNLVSITSGATAFYDGLGNTASNLVAQFGSTGVFQYVSGILRSSLTSSGLTLFDEVGTDIAKFASSTRIGSLLSSHIKIRGTGIEFFNNSSDHSLTIDTNKYGADNTNGLNLVISPPQDANTRISGVGGPTTSNIELEASYTENDTRYGCFLTMQDYKQTDGFIRLLNNSATDSSSLTLYTAGVGIVGNLTVSNRLVLTNKPLEKQYGGTGTANYGEMVNEDISDVVAVATSTYKSIGYVTLSAGIWILTYDAQFASNATGRRLAYMYTSAGSYSAEYLRLTAETANAVNGGSTYLHGSLIVKPTSSTKFYLNVWQNSGNDLNCRGYVRAIRLG